MSTSTTTLPIVPEKEYRAWRTLVVDDNFTNLEFAAAVLEKLGFSCQTATDSDEAFAAMEDVHFDLILLDMNMPGMDGFDMAKQIRSTERSSNVVNAAIIAAISAAAEGSVRSRAFQAGVNYFMTKPLVVSEIRDLLDKVVPKFRHPDPAKRKEALNDLELRGSNLTESEEFDDAYGSSDRSDEKGPHDAPEPQARQVTPKSSRAFGSLGAVRITKSQQTDLRSRAKKHSPESEQRQPQEAEDVVFPRHEVSSRQHLDTQELLKAIVELRAQQPAAHTPSLANQNNLAMLALVAITAVALTVTIITLLS